jgi:hypothetical protein
MVPASFDFWRANLNEPSSAGMSIPSESSNPTARFGFGPSKVYRTLIQSGCPERAASAMRGPDGQWSAVATSSRWAKRSLASARRVGTCSLGTSVGLYPFRVWRATVTLWTSSGPS